MRGRGRPNNRFVGGINALQITAQATCSPCTSLSILEAALPFDSSFKIRRPAVEAWKTSHFLRRLERLDCSVEPWVKSLRISASLQRWIPTKASTATPTWTSIRSVREGRSAVLNPPTSTAIGQPHGLPRATPSKDGAFARSNSHRGAHHPLL